MIALKPVDQTFYDLVVIGGGINGAAVARDAALRGLKVILLEKTDFGAGASTKTSKLAHGGLRYLEQFEFNLVQESLHERDLLLKNAPHLVHPLKFVYPIYTHSLRSLWQVNLGLYVYDFFARDSGLPNHCKLSKEEISKDYPGLNIDELTGGCSYYDAQMKDNRLLMENIISAEQAGAVILNYAKVTEFLWDQGKIAGIIFHDADTNMATTIKCSVVVNTTGAWSNNLLSLESKGNHCRVAPTKGVHLIIPKIVDSGFILRTPQDGRIFFVLPWEGYNLVGATDTFFSGDPDNLDIEETDVEYLLRAVNHHFPNSNLNKGSIISSFVGLRPLVDKYDSKKPSSISRDHVIESTESGLITVLGGKYTTHRLMAEEVVDKVIKHVSNTDPSKVFDKCITKQIPLPGAIFKENTLVHELETVGLNKSQIDHLLQNYGQLTQTILTIIKKNPSESQQICSEHPHTFAELTYAVMFEHVKKAEDWLYRRTTIAYTPYEGKICFDKVAEKIAKILVIKSSQTYSYTK